MSDEKNHRLISGEIWNVKWGHGQESIASCGDQSRSIFFGEFVLSFACSFLRKNKVQLVLHRKQHSILYNDTAAMSIARKKASSPNYVHQRRATQKNKFDFGKCSTVEPLIEDHTETT